MSKACSLDELKNILQGFVGNKKGLLTTNKLLSGAIHTLDVYQKKIDKSNFKKMF